MTIPAHPFAEACDLYAFAMYGGHEAARVAWDAAVRGAGRGAPANGPGRWATLEATFASGAPALAVADNRLATIRAALADPALRRSLGTIDEGFFTDSDEEIRGLFASSLFAALTLPAVMQHLWDAFLADNRKFGAGAGAYGSLLDAFPGADDHVEIKLSVLNDCGLGRSYSANIRPYLTNAGFRYIMERLLGLPSVLLPDDDSDQLRAVSYERGERVRRDVRGMFAFANPTEAARFRTMMDAAGMPVIDGEERQPR